MRFTVLASGSAGNASLLQADGFGVLIDVGLGPRQLAQRLARVGAGWRHVHAVLLTHTHADHWNDASFRHLDRLGIVLWCHAAHRQALQRASEHFRRLEASRRVCLFEADEVASLSPGLRCRPLHLPHDDEATFGFRLEGPADLFGHPCAVGYAADLGSWSPALARALADVDLLALEFNHDVALEQSSGRSPLLIARVLGNRGHLSNEQAAALLHEVLRHSSSRRLRHLVQLHLSRDCNRPALARQCARLAQADHGFVLHTSRQDAPLKPIELRPGGRPSRRPPLRQRRPAVPDVWLPGLAD